MESIRQSPYVVGTLSQSEGYILDTHELQAQVPETILSDRTADISPL